MPVNVRTSFSNYRQLGDLGNDIGKTDIDYFISINKGLSVARLVYKSVLVFKFILCNTLNFFSWSIKIFTRMELELLTSTTMVHASKIVQQVLLSRTSTRATLLHTYIQQAKTFTRIDDKATEYIFSALILNNECKNLNKQILLYAEQQ